MNKLKDLELWSLFFLYTVGVSAFVQMVLLPYILPHLHAGNGLLISSYDSIGFHHIAVDLANKIQAQGWSAWELRPGGQGPSGVAAIFYFLIFPDPRIFIPFQAALHASAALILFKLLNLFVKNQIKAILCILPFLVFPSNLLWTAQVHKDLYGILGFFLILYSIVSLFQLKNLRDKKWYLIIFRLVIFYIMGVLLIWIVRPYMLSIIEPIVGLFIFLLFLVFLIGIFKKEISWQKILFILLLIALTFLILRPIKTNLEYADFKEDVSVLKDAGETAEDVAEDEVWEYITIEEEREEFEMEEVVQPTVIAEPVVEKPSVKKETPIVAVKKEVPVEVVAVQPVVVARSLRPLIEQKISRPKIRKIKVKVRKLIKNSDIENYWKRSSWIPSFIENKFYTLAQIRRGYRLGYVAAKSNLDTNIGFNSVKKVFFYLPRAAQIVFLAPFPNQWFGDASCAANSLLRKISILEMVIIYFTLIFLPYAIWYWRKRIEIWIIFLFCTYMMLVYGSVICNVGTLYRMRYGYITVLVALGIAGLLAFIDQLVVWKKRKRRK